LRLRVYSSVSSYDTLYYYYAVIVSYVDKRMNCHFILLCGLASSFMGAHYHHQWQFTPLWWKLLSRERIR